MQFTDRLALDAPKRTRDGFLAVRAKAARAGVYDYLGKEVDPQGTRFNHNDIVKVYRPVSEVFASDSVASFLAKPVTNNHPNVPVTADNWKDHARGINMGALRDGEYLAFDLVIMDADLISQVEGGKRELSNGYSCSLTFGDGITPDGIAFNATQSNIRGNHIAVVDRGRAGSECRIDDETAGGNTFANCDANPLLTEQISKKGFNMKIMLDGLHVDLTDAEAVKAAFEKVKGDAEKSVNDAGVELVDAKALVATLTAEKSALEKQLADAQAVDLDALVADRVALVATAKALNSKIVTDGKSANDIRKEIVSAELGALADSYDAAQISAAFAVIAKDGRSNADKVVPIVNVNSFQTGDASAIIRNARYA